MTRKTLKIGLIGTGVMGRAYAQGFLTAARLLDLRFEFDLHSVADVTQAAASRAARHLGFAPATTD